MKRKIQKTIRNSKLSPIVRALPNYAQISIPFTTLAIVIGIISYISLTTLAVWNANKRTAYEKEISQKSENVLELESKLSSINKKITPSLALAKGFIENHKVKYVTTKPLTTALRSNETEL